jgi:anti-anti-sigma factor
VTQSAAPDASLRFTSPADRGGYVIAALSGGLGIASAPALREQLVSLLRPAARHLIIDLSAVERADASGLAVLVGSGRRARRLGGSLRLAAPSPEVARVLSATGLNQHLDIFPTVRAAITGQPRLPEAIFPPATVPARGHRIRIDGAVAGVAAQPARPAMDLATAGAGQGLIS